MVRFKNDATPQQSRNLNKSTEIEAVLAQMGLDLMRFLAPIKAQSWKDRLKKSTARSSFGVPTFFGCKSLFRGDSTGRRVCRRSAVKPLNAYLNRPIQDAIVAAIRRRTVDDAFPTRNSGHAKS